MINVRADSERADPAANPDVADAVARTERELDGQGRVVLRPSGTEPVVRVMVEGREEARTRALAERLAGVVEHGAAVEHG
jgi:phosphoglucosamine mutase